MCSPDRRSASRFTYPALTPVSRLSFRLGEFSFRLFLSVLLAPWGCRCACCYPPCGCESARVLPSLLGPSPSGVCHFFSRLFLTHSFPRSFVVVALSASAVGFANALWLCPGRALRRFFASVSLLDPGALSPLLHRVFPDGFRHWCAFRFCGGASPLAFGPVGALGESRWLHLYRLTPVLVGLRHFAGCHWSSGRCFMFYCATFRPYSWRSFG